MVVVSSSGPATDRVPRPPPLPIVSVMAARWQAAVGQIGGGADDPSHGASVPRTTPVPTIQRTPPDRPAYLTPALRFT